MKKYIFNDEETILIIGTAREIRSLYKAMLKREFYPVFSDFPKFNDSKLYGIAYQGSADSFEDGFRVVSERTCLEMILEGGEGK